MVRSYPYVPAIINASQNETGGETPNHEKKSSFFGVTLQHPPGALLLFLFLYRF